MGRNGSVSYNYRSKANVSGLRRISACAGQGRYFCPSLVPTTINHLVCIAVHGPKYIAPDCGTSRSDHNAIRKMPHDLCVPQAGSKYRYPISRYRIQRRRLSLDVFSWQYNDHLIFDEYCAVKIYGLIMSENVTM